MTAVRPITLFTGQWSDTPLEDVIAQAASWGYDGVEIDCGGTHLDTLRAEEDPDYLAGIRRLLDQHGLGVWAVSNHAAGHAVGLPAFDFRHERMLAARIWGDGNADGIRERAREEMIRTARVARRLGVDRVVGFSGSSIWPFVVGFPGVDDDVIDAGFEDFARSWTPVLNAFAQEGVVFAHEPHPGEIAFDYWTCHRAVDAIAGHPAFGFNWDPSHLTWQGIDTVAFLLDFAERIHHVDCKDTRVRPADGRSGILGSHLPWGSVRRAWDFVTVGRGQVRWDDALRALNEIGYDGPVSVEWEDMAMTREAGAAEAAQFLHELQRTLAGSTTTEK
ncbi:sugar phosphate isomerase/epimerase family protein [Ruania alba]|uniref:Sugar phosphate isomerase/epimerase n=1 Tax=Ruania alba TaxID=648782 RepID=A0A1H5LL40_9MICO|nr:sugar phosphate isomerase/epimerase family protein [Ruania alba]SEE77765.1 Sugar phosphate isomerase/epimerase [Ruania alba]